MERVSAVALRVIVQASARGDTSLSAHNLHGKCKMCWMPAFEDVRGTCDMNARACLTPCVPYVCMSDGKQYCTHRVLANMKYFEIVACCLKCDIAVDALPTLYAVERAVGVRRKPLYECLFD